MNDEDEIDTDVPRSPRLNGAFRISNEFATVDVQRRQVPWGDVLEVIDARTGRTIQLDALEVEALTSLDREERRALVYRSGGPLHRTLPISGKDLDDTP